MLHTHASGHWRACTWASPHCLCWCSSHPHTSTAPKRLRQQSSNLGACTVSIVSPLKHACARCACRADRALAAKAVYGRAWWEGGTGICKHAQPAGPVPPHISWLAGAPELFNNIVVFLPDLDTGDYHIRRDYKRTTHLALMEKMLRRGYDVVAQVDEAPSMILTYGCGGVTEIDIDDLELQDGMKLAVVLGSSWAPVNALTKRAAANEAGVRLGKAMCATLQPYACTHMHTVSITDRRLVKQLLEVLILFLQPQPCTACPCGGHCHPQFEAPDGWQRRRVQGDENESAEWAVGQLLRAGHTGECREASIASRSSSSSCCRKLVLVVRQAEAFACTSMHRAILRHGIATVLSMCKHGKQLTYCQTRRLCGCLVCTPCVLPMHSRCAAPVRRQAQGDSAREGGN